MLLDITIHHGGVVQHNPNLQYVGGLKDEIKNYDIDFLSAWENEDVVRDLGYVNDLRYWFKMDDNDVEELGKPLTNDEQVVDFLNIVEVYGLTSVHIYVEHRVDEPDIVGEVLFLPPLEGDDEENVGLGNGEGDAGLGNAEGDAGLGNADGDAGLGNVGYAVDAENIEGNVDGDATTKPSKKKERVSQKKGKNPKGGRKKRGGAKGARVSARRKNGAKCSVPDVPDLVDEEELQLSDFEITDDDDDLFTSDVPINKEYMENWWGKFVGEEPHANTGHEDGEEYYDSEELMSLDGSDDELT
jgi:hypothetical protein